jgi:hypothetical protein
MNLTDRLIARLVGIQQSHRKEVVAKVGQLLDRRPATVLVLLLATFAPAQTSQFLFDPNGNLTVQLAESVFPPQILGQPQNQVVATNESAAFSVIVADPRSMTFQWRFNGSDLNGATGSSLLLDNVVTGNEGAYQVVLTNPSGSITSAPAFLILDGDGDGLGDSWELTYFTNLNATATADVDRDGVSNLQEFFDDTNPTNSASARYRLLVLRDGGSVIRTPDQASYTNGEAVTLTAIASPGSEPFHAWLGGIVTQSNPVTIVMTSNTTIYARFTPIEFIWTNPSGGEWIAATNWTPNLVPGLNDSVIIARSLTVTLNTPADCADVTLGSGTTGSTLTGSGTLTVRRNFLWTSGTMSGSGKTLISAGATLTVGSSNQVSLSRILENSGTVLWTGAGGITLFSGAVITNRPGALFDVQNAAILDSSGGGIRFDNAGTFRKSVHAGTSTLGSSVIGSSVGFNNFGLVEIQSGMLLFNCGFTNSGTVNLSPGTTHRLAGGGRATGTFDASPGALVEWTGGLSFALDTGAQLNGTGLYKINNALLSRNADLTVENLHLALGTLTATGTVTIASAMNWISGTMSGPGRTVIEPGAMLMLANPSGLGLSLNTRTLENGGLVLWTGSGDVALNSGAVVTNRAGALFEVRNASSLQANVGTGRFDNTGTFRKVGNTGTTIVASSVPFNNSGTVDIRSGILAANGGYISTSNALLNCALGGTTAGTNYGQLQVAGAVTLNGTLSVDLINGFVPTTNDSFTVLTAGARTGSFANFLHPSNLVTMQLSTTPNAVFVRSTGFPVPELVLFPPLITSSNVTLCWMGESNKTYRLEFSPDLGPTNWFTVPGEVSTSNHKTCLSDALTASNRFYRVRVLP